MGTRESSVQILVFAAMSLHQAAKNSDVNAINELLDDESVDIDALDENGFTALHHVAVTGNAAIGAMLAECDADVNLADPQGNTPLHLAAKHNSRLGAAPIVMPRTRLETRRCTSVPCQIRRMWRTSSWRTAARTRRMKGTRTVSSRLR